ncbi:UDP-glucose 4-epimerase [Acidithiobacillus marinus]|uniref:UDP-glucose 4-epimerase n=1 Tax=Acidithiobacillus marinus TaxID=187490 RepID=A0A2I1DQX4_9PROT|nr:NAD-dependent epimerase/dehydratase family protein [Acidithiobacillus marinus]PKY12280.1 UDP-glucose 4-epimerase [Acidithiobacillus marinus]
MQPNQQTAIILVVGGAGFIGSHTVELLLSEGYYVRVLDNLSTGKRENLPATHDRLDFILGDMTDQTLLGKACAGVTHILHLAAQVSVIQSFANPVFSCQQNILGFVAVLDEARKQHARLVYASSAAVYGNPEILPINENAQAMPISPYGLEKYSNELYADLYGRMHQLSHLGMRYFNVYGPRQDPQSPYSGVISRFVAQALAHESLTIRGDGSQERDFIHVNDVAQANVAALLGDTLGTMNIACGKATTILSLAKIIHQLLGVEEDIQWVPLVEGDIHRSLADNERMRRHLCQPLWSLPAGLQHLLQVMRADC